MGDRVSGSPGSADRELDDGSRVQAWALEARAGQTVNIALDSDAFDALLYLIGPGITSPMSDDNNGGELNARLTVTFPETGTYTVVVSGAMPGATGAFRVLHLHQPQRRLVGLDYEIRLRDALAERNVMAPFCVCRWPGFEWVGIDARYLARLREVGVDWAPAAPR